MNLPPQSPAHPIDVSQMLMQGFAHFQAGSLDLTEAACAQVLEALPGQPDALHLQGLVHNARGQHEEALACIDAALGQADSAPLHSNRGNVLRALGHLPEAIESYRHALEHEPNSLPLLLNLAFVLRDTGNLEDCAAVCTRILAIDPRNVHALQVRADCLWRAGRDR